MKSTYLIFVCMLITISCSKKFDITEHFDPDLAFEIIDMDHPSGVMSETEIQLNDPKHNQLLAWMKSNNHNWESTHNTNAGLIIVTQGDFKILFYRDSDFIVVGYTDEEKVRHQYKKFMDSNELRFLVNE